VEALAGLFGFPGDDGLIFFDVFVMIEDSKYDNKFFRFMIYEKMINTYFPQMIFGVLKCLCTWCQFSALKTVSFEIHKIHIRIVKIFIVTMMSIWTSYKCNISLEISKIAKPC
jgi:hypothetical protein